MRGRKPLLIHDLPCCDKQIKKESPNEGTETLQSFGWGAKLSRINKKRIPE